MKQILMPCKSSYLDMLGRLIEEKEKYLEIEIEPFNKINYFLNNKIKTEQSSEDIIKIISDKGFSIEESNHDILINQMIKVYPSEILTALKLRLEKGIDIPNISWQLFSEYRIITNNGIVVEIALKGDQDNSGTKLALFFIGSTIIDKLINEYIYVSKELHSAINSNETIRKRYWDLVDRMKKTDLNDFIYSLSSRPMYDDMGEIAALANLVQIHGNNEFDFTKITYKNFEKLIESISNWGEYLLKTDNSSRSDLANIAAAIGCFKFWELYTRGARATSSHLNA